MHTLAARATTAMHRLTTRLSHEDAGEGMFSHTATYVLVGIGATVAAPLVKTAFESGGQGIGQLFGKVLGLG